MKLTILCTLLGAAGLFVACDEPRHEERIDGWFTSIEAGQRAAGESGKPLLLVFR